MANYAIGDIQGCYSAFCRLLEKIQFDSTQDKLWLAGDMVNRGENSLGTLRLVYELAQQGACEAVLGNHDLHMLAVYHGCAQRKRKDNFFDVLDAPDAAELLHWLQQQSLCKKIIVNEHSYFLSHSGLPPIWSVDKAINCAREVEVVLQGKSFKEFFNTMYGNTPNGWQETLEGAERLRVITNYFTRMRFCNAAGQLELQSKGNSEERPVGFKPWFEFDNAHLNHEILLFGHWAALQGKTNKDHIFALDTGCVWGNSLSALRLEDKQRFCCDC